MEWKLYAFLAKKCKLRGNIKMKLKICKTEYFLMQKQKSKWNGVSGGADTKMELVVFMNMEFLFLPWACGFLAQPSNIKQINNEQNDPCVAQLLLPCKEEASPDCNHNGGWA